MAATTILAHFSYNCVCFVSLFVSAIAKILAGPALSGSSVAALL
jgi:hypothetical protein